MQQSPQQQQQSLFNHQQTLLDNKALRSFHNPQEDKGGVDDETRSVRSEFDYATKKKFVDIVKTNPNRSKLN